MGRFDLTSASALTIDCHIGFHFYGNPDSTGQYPKEFRSYSPL